MSDKTANQVINVSHVFKDFSLPHHNQPSSIKNIFTNPRSVFNSDHDTAERQHALKDVSFSVEKGEFFGIVGRNGSGKSTLLKILAQIYQPTRGQVYVKGKLVPFIELGVGFNHELTGKENVYLSAALLGFSKSETEEMYDDIVKFAELERFMDQKLKNYSSGMQVRLAFSIATRVEGDILLIDEVLAVGDADFQRKCFDYFKQLKKKKKTVVFVSHDMAAVREYCDKVILIEKNSVVASGNPREVASLYTQLFNVPEGKRGSLDRGDRWGDHEVKIKSVKTYVNSNYVRLSVKITPKISIEDIDVGINIKDAQGLSIIATSTKLIGKTINLDAGQDVGIDFSFDNILNDGTYYVDAAITKDGGVSVKDWWEECSDLQISKEIITPSLANPNVSIDIHIKE